MAVTTAFSQSSFRALFSDDAPPPPLSPSRKGVLRSKQKATSETKRGRLRRKSAGKGLQREYLTGPSVVVAHNNPYDSSYDTNACQELSAQLTALVSLEKSCAK
ncbi:unnamed protein product [Musa banksii]